MECVCPLFVSVHTRGLTNCDLYMIFVFFLICRLQALLDRTSYTLDVTTGQRKYGDPPPESVYSGAQPTVGTEVWFCTDVVMKTTVDCRPPLLYGDFLVLLEKHLHLVI